MDTNIFTCMEAAGIITEAQRSAMVKAAVGLPETMIGVLSVIAASSLVGGADGAFYGEPIGTESITSSGVADVKALTVPAGATKAIVSIHGNNIIFRTDGGDPAALTGHVGLVNSNINIGSLHNFKFVSQVAGNATIFVSYF